jgi:hypothetical protein
MGLDIHPYDCNQCQETYIRYQPYYSDWNREDSVISKIIHINFINLKHISFSANRIVNIECLHRLQAPNLKELSLTNNLITSFRSFRKGHFSQLQILDICKYVIDLVHN